MALIIAGVAVPDAMEVQITIRATMRELKDYTANNEPSHSVAHRLTEAIEIVRRKLETTVSETVERS